LGFLALSITIDECPSGVFDYKFTAGLASIEGMQGTCLALTMVYSGFSHFCFWQCSESIFTGSFPVHDAPPISFFTSGLFGASPARAGPSWAEGPPADDPPLLGTGFLGLGSLSEFEKTMKLSSPPAVGGEGFFAPPPPPGFPPFACPFLTIV